MHIFRPDRLKTVKGVASTNLPISLCLRTDGRTDGLTNNMMVMWLFESTTDCYVTLFYVTRLIILTTLFCTTENNANRIKNLLIFLTLTVVSFEGQWDSALIFLQRPSLSVLFDKLICMYLHKQMKTVVCHMWRFWLAGLFVRFMD